MNFDTLVHLVEVYRYWILFPLVCFEGPIVAFVVGTLVALGYFNPVPAYIVLLFGDIIPDTGYYFLGRFGEKKTLIQKYLVKLGITGNHLDTIYNLWHKHPGKTMFFGKLAYGLSTPILISAGLAGMQFKKFFRYAFPITVAQFAILMALGYYFGNSYYNVITESFSGVGFVIAAAILVGIGYYFFAQFMRRKLLETEGGVIKTKK